MINRDMIEDAAVELGAPMTSVMKWRQRHVPYRWQILIANRLGVSPYEVEKRSRI
jgi:hypothetical protein